MTNQNRHRDLRLWPGVTLVALSMTAALVMALAVPGGGGQAVFAGVFGGLGVLAWWLFFSRAAWLERLGAVAVMAAGVALTRLAVHPSIANGMMGLMLYIHAIPVLALALVAGAVIARRRSPAARLTSLVGAIALGCAVFTVVRTGGISGDAASDFHWRWTPTPEEVLLARPAEPATPVTSPAAAAPSAPGTPAPPSAVVSSTEPAPMSPVPSIGGPALPVATPPEWPGFRGAARDSAVAGVRLATDWVQSPPVEIWRRPIGPGWSSFAVHGDLIYTQEQRGEQELVTCYRLSTGAPVWRHADAVRFWESNGGAGPRATPTIHGNRIYTLGATGLVNALDAATGAAVWTRNAATDTGRAVPDWGFSGSPVVVEDTVIVALSGQLAAYDARSGQPRWRGSTEGGGYSSPHLVTLQGVPQIVLLRGGRTTSVSPADGTVLWEHFWQPGAAMLQPALTADGDLLITTGDAMGGAGMRRIAVTRGPAGWTTEERWTTRGLKPYFNDFVVHKSHAYGFDGSILAAADLADGARRWKGGRYGHGQMLLMPDQDLLLVLSEEGEIALVSATPDKFTELARMPALDGKTWNHPVLVGHVLLVRNGEEMAAFRLPPAGR